MADPKLQQESVRRLIEAYGPALKTYRADLDEKDRQAVKAQWSETFESLGIDFNAENRLIAVATLVALISSSEGGLDPEEIAISHLMALLDSFLK